MKKILLISNASWTMVKFRRGLMQELVKKNYKVYVASPYDEYSKEIESIGCRYIDIKMDNKGSNPLKDMKLTYDLYRLYRDIQPDLIFHYTIKPNIYGSFATKLAGCKSISIIPGLGYTFINENFTAKVAKYLYKIALKIPLEVWFINQDDKKEFLSRDLVNEDKIRTINGEGVNIETFQPMEIKKKGQQFVFLMIARVLKDKGVYEYIEAARKIKSKYKNVKFQLLGSIYTLNPASIRKEEINIWEREGLVDYLGEVTDVRKYIAMSDCIVLPSYREGLSMSLLESASMAKPIITTNVPGCKDVVDDGINGYLCEVKNVEALADKMEVMINLTQRQRLDMGQAGRQRVIEEFDEKIIIKKYLNSIKEILG